MNSLRQNRTAAHTAPFLAFMLLLVPVDWIKIDNPTLPWWRCAPEHWIYPLQTVVALGLIWYFRKNYTFGPRGVRPMLLGLIVGTAGIAVWVLPSVLFHRWQVASWPWPDWVKTGLGLVSRSEPGFDPDIFSGNSAAWWTAVLLRFVRMAVAVPLLEELFWRSFLWRHLAEPNRDFWLVPFGVWNPAAVGLSILAFTLVHHPSDYLGCLIYGVLISWVALRTRSLAACVVCHAVSNLLLGLYVVQTKQWGFW
ncbi:MAG: CAAX prenyl protease-related protein [Verrucomicrobiales bacterium]|nr:CAAX prenyl protease-related protein [Verrucomicrobiales bacterium]